MARKRKLAPKKMFKPPTNPVIDPDGDDAMLVNKLSLREARHLVRTEGGVMTRANAVSQLVTTLVVSAFVARAIIVGKATVWHLILPLLGEYFALLVSQPVLSLTLKDDTLRKNARNCLVMVAFYSCAAAVWVAFQSSRQGNAWTTQAGIETARLWTWIVGYEMHWPILGAALGFLFTLPGRVRSFRKYGPPFVPVGLGCGMRFVVILFGCFLIPWIIGDSRRVTWAVWAVLFLAELGALLMRWDLQQRLRKRGIAI